MVAFQTSIPVTVITGFLGSGKTTLLSALLNQPDMQRTAVIINEFGKVGIDHYLIERREENIIELQNGCICCTIRGDLLITLKDLVDKMAFGKVPEFDRVIVETTGLADPVPIVHTLMTAPDLFRIYTLDSVVTVVDAVNGEPTLDKHVESMKQAAMADRLIVSKADIADPETLEKLTSRLKTLNPAARLIQATQGNVAVSELFGLGTYDPYNKNRNVQNWLNYEAYLDKKQPERHSQPHQHSHNPNRHNDEIESFAMTYKEPINFVVFSFFLELMKGQVGPDLLRVKGIINIEGRDSPAVIHGVQHVFHPVQWLDAWPDEDRSTRLVFITKNIPQENIKGFFNALLGAAKE